MARLCVMYEDTIKLSSEDKNTIYYYKGNIYSFDLVVNQKAILTVVIGQRTTRELMGYFHVVLVQARSKMQVVPYRPSCPDPRHGMTLVLVSCRHDPKLYKLCHAQVMLKDCVVARTKIAQSKSPALMLMDRIMFFQAGRYNAP